MTVGELLVDLKITGGNAAAGQIGVTVRALGEAKKMAIETKAAMLAAVVAAQRLLAGPTNEGAGYAKFERLTGVSAEYLQRVQASLAQQQLSFDETQSFVLRVNEQVAQMQVTKGMIPGLQSMAAYLSKVGVSLGDMTNLTLPQLLEFYRKFAQLPDDIVSKNQKLIGAAAAGIDASVLQALMGAKTPFEKMPVDDMITGKQAAQLEKSAVGLGKVERQLKRMATDFVAKYGADLVDGLSKIIRVVERLANGLVKVAEALKVFDAIGSTFKAISGVVENTASAFERIDSVGSKLSKDPKMLEALKGMKGIAPTVKPSASAEKHSSVLNQTVNITGDVNDPKAVSNSILRETKTAYRMMSAQVQKV